MGYDNERHMPPPDWARVLVNTDQKRMAVGDPTLWGNTLTTPIDVDPLTIVEGPIVSAQIIRAQASDHYSRSWSISGTLTLPRSTWSSNLPGVDPPSGLPPGATSPALQVYLSVLQGIEKVTIEHQICLMYGGTAGNIGLCNNQCTLNGGPYLPTFAFGGTASTDDDRETRPFAAIGALIGNAISARAIYVRANTDEIVIRDATIALLLAPSAAGTGL